jgi:ubiquinone/menaquinone biosynthesis C-methylase UbiE
MPAPQEAIRALAADDLYAAVLELFADAPPGRILDVPAGHGAFAHELLKRGHGNIDCLDIAAETFALRDPRVRFTRHDVIHPLPFPDAHFDYVFSIEGIEHFENPWTFARELCRVLKPGGRLIISTPNTFSVDARVKYLLAGYYPRFRPLMLDPDKVMVQPVDDAHISPIYYWQLNFFLRQGGVSIRRVSTNALVRKPQWIKRMLENLIARIIRDNIRRRGLPDHGVSSDAVLFGDCLVIEGVKA